MSCDFASSLRPLWQIVDGLATALASVELLPFQPDHIQPTPDGHRHVIPTLVVPLRGMTRILGGRQRYDLLPGQALLVAPLATHRHAPLHPEAVYLHQGFMHRWSDVAFMIGARWLTGTFDTEPSRGWLEAALIATPKQRRDLVCRCLARIVDQGLSPLVEPHPAVWRMAYHIWWNFESPISAAMVLRSSGLGRSQAHALFTNYFGVTPKQEILRRRLAAAQRLLAVGYSVTAAATACGFTDRAALTRACRRSGLGPPRRMLADGASSKDVTPGGSHL